MIYISIVLWTYVSIFSLQGDVRRPSQILATCEKKWTSYGYGSKAWYLGTPKKIAGYWMVI